MHAVLIATITALLTVYGAWKLDQEVLKSRTVFRAIASVVLLGTSVWVVVLIKVSLLLKIPGAYGPVQYWVGDQAAHDFMSGPRVWAFFAILGGMWIAGLVTLSTLISLPLKSKGTRWFRIVVPSMSIAIFALACYWLITCGFYPSA